ncbi:hypothetical protein [Enterobacter phage 01_vB_Eclo_IJM]|nr:hypothetical protein [Enterobacter phage 01_vB_Eclo_IJM]
MTEVTFGRPAHGLQLGRCLQSSSRIAAISCNATLSPVL